MSAEGAWAGKGRRRAPWFQISNMSFTSGPLILQPVLKRSMRKARKWPKGVVSVATMQRPCPKAMLAVPMATLVLLGSTRRPCPTAARRAAISPASRSAALSPVEQMSNQPGGMVRRARLRANAFSKRCSPRRMSASVVSACLARRSTCAVVASNSGFV